jgi:phosphatidylglycerophosphatase A
VGYFPVAPGTAGTAAAAIIYWFIAPGHLLIYGAITVVFFFLGARASTVVERQQGPDPSLVVIDEMVGFWIALLALPKTWPVLLIAFFLFRIFDIWKPFPVRRAERLPEGWGIMADDAIAGIYTNLLLHLALFLRG